jgi:hypothetical protein
VVDQFPACHIVNPSGRLALANPVPLAFRIRRKVSLHQAVAMASTPQLASFRAFLMQARRLQGQGGDRLARDHIAAALGVAMSVARQEAESAIARGRSVAEALDAAIEQLQRIRDSLPSPQ